MSTSRLILLASLVLVFAGCVSEEGSDFEPFDPTGDMSLQVLVTEGMGATAATVRAELFDDRPAGDWVTDGQGWFTMDGDPGLREAGGIRWFADKGRYSVDWELAYGDATRENMRDFGPFFIDSSAVERAVVVPTHDQMLDTLDSINFQATSMTYPGPDTSTDYVNVLTHPTLLEAYDVMVFPSGMDEGWYEFHEDVVPNLQDFVAGGGSMLVSDRAYNLVEALDPEAIDFAGDDSEWGAALVGEAGPVEGWLVDPVLQLALPDVEVAEFQLGEEGIGWTVISGLRDDVEVLVEALDDETPLAVAWQPYEDGGQVVFTSIVNPGQPSGETWRVLAELLVRL